MAKESEPRTSDQLSTANQKHASKAHVVLSPNRRAKRIREREAAGAAILKVLGFTFLVLGLVDLLLLWIPAQLGNSAWEFATASQSLDSLPMVALGLGLVAYAVVTGPGPSLRHGIWMYWLFAVGAVALLATAALYATAAPAVLRGTPVEALDSVRRVIAKSSLQFIAYLGLLVGIAADLRARTRPHH